MQSINWNRIGIFFTLFVLYVFLVLSLGEIRLWQDSLEYFSYATSLLQTGVYGILPGVPDMNREPGYSVFFAGVIWILKFFHLIQNYEEASQPVALRFVVIFQAALLFLSAYLAAFRAGLQGRVRPILFGLLLLSPSILSCQRDLYSEAVSVPLSLFLLFFFARASDSSRGRINVLAGGICWAAIVMTKAYFQYMTFFFLILAVAGFYRSRTSQKCRLLQNIAIAFSFLFLGGFIAQSQWAHRNHVLFGKDTAVMRQGNALAGRVVRLEQADLFHHLDIAVAASLGTNFCDRHYGVQACIPFNYLGCDAAGLVTWRDYVSRYPSKSEASKALTHDMVKRYLQHPVLQAAGTALELLRMGLFEGANSFTALPEFLQKLSGPWHFFGSLIFLYFIFFAMKKFLNEKWAQKTDDEKALYLFAMTLILYHVLLMSQLTNVARYIYPVLPFIYLWVAAGIDFSRPDAV